MAYQSAPTNAPEPQEASGRERAGYMMRHSKRWLIALILLGVAIAIAATSLAVFSSSSANPSNTATAGILSQSNSSEGDAILTALNMVPGDSQEGTVTIENTGTVEGTFTLTDSDLLDTPGANGGNLSEVLQLSVVDNSVGGGTPVYEGAFNAMPDSVALPGTTGAAWQPDEVHDFTFTVTFPDAGLPASATTEDNAYQGSEVTVTYNWNAVSN